MRWGRVMKISVVTINRNNGAGLARTLESIVRQELSSETQTEVIIQDGASTDGSLDCVEILADIDHSVVSEPDSGVYDAMNKGAELARGQYLLFLNSGDALATSTALETMRAFAEESGSPALVIFGARDMRGFAGYPQTIRNVPYSWLLHAMSIRPHCHQSILFDAARFRALNGYSQEFDFVGDFDLIVRMGFGGSSASCNEVLVDYEGGGLSAQRREEIPRLHHQVRVIRFGLPPVLSRLDVDYMRLLEFYWRVSDLRVGLTRKIRAVQGLARGFM